MSNMLQGKRAAVFGAGGSIGAAIARGFATEGADVFLSGRTRSNVEEVSKQIASAGGRSHLAVLDAGDCLVRMGAINYLRKETEQ